MTSQRIPNPQLDSQASWLPEAPIARLTGFSPGQRWKPGWQRGMVQAPSLYALHFHLQCLHRLHRGRPGLSQAAVWAPLQSLGGQRGEETRLVFISFWDKEKWQLFRQWFPNAGPGIATSPLSEERGGWGGGYGILWYMDLGIGM